MAFLVEMPDRQRHGIRHAARRVDEGAVGHAGFGRQLGAVPHGHCIDRLAGDEISQIGPELGAIFGFGAFRVVFVGLVDNPLINAGVHLQRRGFPHQHPGVILAVVPAVGGEELTPLRIGRRGQHQHRAWDRHHARPERAQDFHVGIEACLVRAPEGELVAQDRRIGVAAGRSKGGRADLDMHPVGELDRLAVPARDQGLEHRHRLQELKHEAEDRPRLPLVNRQDADRRHLAGGQKLLIAAKTGEIDGDQRQSPRLAAPPADNHRRLGKGRRRPSCPSRPLTINRLRRLIRRLGK